MIPGQTALSAAYHHGPTVDADHFLYRCYDAAGDLIYIGCTSNVQRRIAAHRKASGGSKASRWLSVFMDRYEVEGPFRGRDAGRQAEAVAINLEQPLFNYQQRAGIGLAAWMTRRSVAEYLVERGHITLAIETACGCSRGVREQDAYQPSCVAHAAAQVEGITHLRSTGTFTDADWDAA